MSDFMHLPDLASTRLGGQAVVANDEFFAPKENLVLDAAPIFDPARYTDRGKWMDGWETRRRRDPGHDWCVVRLGVPGVVRGVVVDTAHFRGNHPRSVFLDASRLVTEPERWEDVEWSPLVPESTLAGDARNPFAVSDGGPWTHVRLSIVPDGGVARLRVHGVAAPDWALVSRTERRGHVEVASIARGGVVTACSDEFFGAPNHLLLPDDSEGMWDGWETRRRRDTGHDWVIVRLGHRVRVEQVEVDTRHFKGNYPGSASVDGIDATDAGEGEPSGDSAAWRELVPRRPLRPDVAHILEPPELSPTNATHVRLSIFPDGGVARLRVRGTLLG